MKKYYKVSFQYSESVYCTNIAHAETAADVEAHYSKYAWYSVKEAASYEVEEATRKGMPVIEIEPAQVEEAQNEQEEGKPHRQEVQNMRTYKAKSSSYNSVNTECLIEYIADYNKEIAELLQDNPSMLRTDRAKLKSIAAELETVIKQLKATRGIY